MPRPCKRRRICSMPINTGFTPVCDDLNQKDRVVMTLDEYETIRLIDFENLTQEECAARMGVARTTAQAIYNNARFKLAKCLVEGLSLKVEGGQYIICEGNAGCENCKHCHNKEENCNENCCNLR